MTVTFERAWQLARLVEVENHSPKCTFFKTEGTWLCDCDVLFKHPEVLDCDHHFGKDGEECEKGIVHFRAGERCD